MSEPNMIAVKGTPKATLDRGVNYAAKQARQRADEEELERLMKEHFGEPVDLVEEDVEEEEDEVVEVEEAPKEPKPKPKAKSKEKNKDEESSWQKRYGDLRSHMSRKEKAWEEEKKALVAQASSSDAPQLRSEEDVAKWVESNPEVASMIEAIADRKANERFSAAQDQFERLDEVRFEAERAQAENEIRKVHKDFDELRESDKFHDWVDAQPQWIQDALYENADDAKSVVRVIDLYKTDNGLTAKAKRQKTKAAAAPAGRSAASRTSVDETGGNVKIRESDVEKMSAKEFESRFEEIQTAMQSGNFIYDISGS